MFVLFSVFRCPPTSVARGGQNDWDGSFVGAYPFTPREICLCQHNAHMHACPSHDVTLASLRAVLVMFILWVGGQKHLLCTKPFFDQTRTKKLPRKTCMLKTVIVSTAHSCHGQMCERLANLKQLVQHQLTLASESHQMVCQVCPCKNSMCLVVLCLE